jgi:hypothetical protein
LRAFFTWRAGLRSELAHRLRGDSGFQEANLRLETGYVARSRSALDEENPGLPTQ